ncbi:uncharacterized protein LOC115727911 [Rhodamnia argentea]|uniref:Uncharacterized protein LOC115727911 n=1 Tax=Rhodamnia argentea TaxID=178133 RepID=A0A8B8MVG8_9MYRT|nr:uncharacterized protein LOC115727911 [Rhodamnia argentea]
MALRWLLHSACNVLGHPDHDAGGVNHHASAVSGMSPACRDAAKSLKKTSGAKEATLGFQMPLHYPRYKKVDYESMEEWRLDMLLRQYGLSFNGNLDEKRAYAMGAFLWPGQY